MLTNFDEILKTAQGQEVELPGWDANTTVTVLLKRPSLMDMAASGSIRNDLMGAVAELFEHGIQSGSNADKFKGMSEALLTVAKAAMVNPTYKQLEEAGINLTDQQLIYINNFVNTGLDTLRRFRTLAADRASD